MATKANITKLAGAGLLAALLSSTPAFAQVAWEEEGWDTDGDGLFSMEEFREGFRERINFAKWDADADGMLSEEEFGGGIYDRYDADASGAFEETEYSAMEEDFGTEGVWRYRGEELTADPGEGLETEEVADAEIVDSEINGVETEVTDVEALGSEGVIEDDIGDAGVGIGEGLAENEALGEDEVGLGEDFAELEAWDVDGDGVMLRNEFQDGFREWGTFGEFDVDRDGGITEDELTDGIFTRYDDDGTGFIEEPELTDIGDDMGDEGFWDV